MLHTVNKSPYDKNSLETCLGLAKDGSQILLIEDGVYAAIAGASIESEVKSALGKHKVYALGPDLKARGISDAKLIDGIEVVSYDGFVELAANSDGVQSWL